jgi:hypothetical protein
LCKIFLYQFLEDRQAIHIPNSTFRRSMPRDSDLEKFPQMRRFLFVPLTFWETWLRNRPIGFAELHIDLPNPFEGEMRE